MKIVFVTSCLEPGKDGVGDYTRLLAQECEKQGHKCLIISLNDHFIQNSHVELENLSQKISEIRVSAYQSWSKRIHFAKEKLDLFDPDWVSLQFVCYGFQKKGVIYGLCKYLRFLFQQRQLHIMFHELWIGISVTSSIKDRSIGSIQKFFICKLNESLQPKIVHTSNSAYLSVLKQNNITAKILPIFSNIAISDINADHWLLPRLRQQGLEIYPTNRNEFWLIGFFGSLEPTWPPEPLFTYLNEAGIIHQRKIAFISIGKLRTGQSLWNELSTSYATKFTFLQLDEQPELKISQFLKSIDFGISNTSYLLSGKSGTVAAMLEHGVPIIVNRNDFQLPFCTDNNSIQEDYLYEMNFNLPRDIITWRKSNLVEARLTYTAKQFINDLCLIAVT